MTGCDVRIRENSPLARIAARRLRTSSIAMVIGHTIHLYNVSREDFLRRETWVCHELRHVAQYDRYGVGGFLVRYLWESLRRGYYANRFEIEARASETERDLLSRYTFLPAVQPANKMPPGAADVSAPSLSLPHSHLSNMAHNKIQPTGRQKSIFYLHLVIFIVATIVMVFIHKGQEKAAGAWVYPWHAWPIAAWALAVIGHLCALWTSYTDPGMDEYARQTQNG